MVDLRLWTNAGEDRLSRSDGYAAAFGLFTEVARLVPRERLWREEWTWAEFDALLLELGDSAAPLRAALDGGTGMQRRYFGDIDEDGLIGADELRAGTDPVLRDTDGDGWWDGVPSTMKNAMRRADRVPTCLGVRAGPLGATFDVRAVDEQGRPSKFHVHVDGKPPPDDSRIPPGASLAVSARAESSIWAGVDGVGLVSDERCGSAPGLFVLAERGREDALVPFIAAFQRVNAVAIERLGADPGVSVSLGNESLDRRLRGIHVRSTHIEWAESHEWDFVAALVVARSRLDGMTVRVHGIDADAYEALARWLVTPPPDTLLLGWDEAGIAQWQHRADSCGGWRTLVTQGCIHDP